MTPISHLLEPSRLLLVWQRPLIDSGRRSRRVIGEIVRNGEGETVFRYMSQSDDFRLAAGEGFQGYPAFRLARAQHDENVLEAFTCRLPSRKRGDFTDYLAAHGLPSDFSGSDFSLLAHTGAKLPGDGFEIIPDLAGIAGHFDLIVEAAGTRHQEGVDLGAVSVGDSVSLLPEPTNEFDPAAIEIVHSAGGRIGYVPKPYCEMLRPWLDDGRLSASIQKLNGRPDRRLVYLRIGVT